MLSPVMPQTSFDAVRNQAFQPRSQNALNFPASQTSRIGLLTLPDLI